MNGDIAAQGEKGTTCMGWGARLSKGGFQGAMFMVEEGTAIGLGHRLKKRVTGHEMRWDSGYVLL